MATRIPDGGNSAVMYKQLASLIPPPESYPAPETLTSLRTKKSPIRLSVDGQVLWEMEVPLHTVGIAKRMLSFCYLPQGWDSREAEPANINCVIAAISLMSETFTDATPLPHVVPTVGGGVQMEWHLQNIDAEIEILTPTRVALYFLDREGNEVESEQGMDQAFSEVLKFLDKLSV